MALFGLAVNSPATVVLPPAEHPATEESVSALESQGWTRHTLPLSSDGRLNPGSLDDVAWSNVKLATLMLAHNETGVIQDVDQLAHRCAEHAIPWHVDAVQAVGKIPIDFRQLGATSLALGAHKFHGPRGIGALLVREGTRLTPTQYGGHQESGRRPGTECVALAAGMATALKLWHADREQRTAHVRNLRDRMESSLRERCGPVVTNGSREHRLPNTLNMAFPGIDGDALLVSLDLEGVCVSLGSACASGSSEPAPILIAIGCPRDVSLASVRLSVGIDNTIAEIDTAIERIATIVERLRQSTKTPGVSN